MYTLYNWKFEGDNDGYLWIVGDWSNGRGWQTSSIDRFELLRDGYRVVTKNSVYFLPWY
jgi:hypothetical protein